VSRAEADDLARMAEVALQVAEEAAAVAQAGFRARPNVEHKGVHDLVTEFDRRFHQPVPPLRTASLGAFDPPRDAGRSGRGSPTWSAVAIGALVVVLIFLGVSWIVGRGGDSAPLTGPTGPAATAAPTASPTPARTTDRPPAARTPLVVVVRLRATGGSSWVSVTGSDGAAKFAGILADGQAREFRDARELSVRFGNASAVRVTQNGKDVGSPRCGTQVCTVAFGLPAAG